MESNRNNPEFSFPEAELVKSTELFRNCKNIVVGDGNLDAEIMFIGEAPGRNEDESGIPFCGAAGKNLDILLAKVELERKNIYIANILKCRPSMNRDPLPEEIKFNTPWLLKQIREIKPKVICSLGNYSTKFFLAKCNVDDMDKQPGITQLHGKVQKIKIDNLDIKLIPLFHPAAIIYNRSIEPLWINDMNVVREEIKL